MKKKLSIFARITPLVCGVLVVKWFAHFYGLELLSLNPFFPGLVAANIFLMGFLLSGVLSDFKESERLPGELVASLYIIFEESLHLYTKKKIPAAKACLEHTEALAKKIRMWLYKEEKTKHLMELIFELGQYFHDFEPALQPNFIVRLKQEQTSVRKNITRIHHIRETNFVSAAYYMAVFISVLLVGGLILLNIEPFAESLFFVGIISALLLYLLFLIRDLDNPFGYYDKKSVEDISLKPLDDLISFCEIKSAEIAES